VLIGAGEFFYILRTSGEPPCSPEFYLYIGAEISSPDSLSFLGVHGKALSETKAIGGSPLSFLPLGIPSKFKYSETFFGTFAPLSTVNFLLMESSPYPN